jgi:hypothetical protein
MPNLSYCRFQITAADLRECAHHLTDKLGVDEAAARIVLCNIAIDILTELGIDVDTGSHPNAKWFVEQAVLEHNPDTENVGE